jgi:hypothetical protein
MSTKNSVVSFLDFMEKIPSKMVRKLILNFTLKNGPKYPFLSCLKRTHLENRLSVKAEILHGSLKKISLDLMKKIP